MMPHKNYWLPGEHAEYISRTLRTGKRLVACLCADWCTSCQVWQEKFSLLTEQYPTDCFVWLDIDKHPDMVADVDLDTLPVLLIQDPQTIRFLGPIRPDVEVVKRLLTSRNLAMQALEPGIRDFLLEDGREVV